MRKHVAILVILFLAGEGLAGAATINTFEGGETEAIAELEAPDFGDVLNISIPVQCHVRKATVNVTSVAPDGTRPGCPANVSVMLNDTVLWEFEYPDFGPLGRQDSFINSTKSWSTQFGRTGGSDGTKIRLPKRAVVLKATMTIDLTGPGTMVQRGPIHHPGTWARFGFSLAAAGDVNGDGFDDLLVGAKGNDSAAPPSGAAYLHFGQANGSLNTSLAFTGAGNNDGFGYSVAGAGDLNGDGRPDLVIGSPFEDAGYTDNGRVYVYHGGAGMDTVADAVLTGAAGRDNFGAAVASAGDFNGDGTPDILVGAPGADGGAGAAYVFFGGKSLNQTPDLTLKAGGVNAHTGASLDFAGDVDGDGIDDIVVGAPGANSASLFYGGRSPDGTLDASFYGAAGDSLGTSVSAAGDVNGDGYDDIIAGAPGHSSSFGAAYIYLGGPEIDNTPDVTLPGDVQMSYFGYSVSDVGDLDRDGYDDVLVGGYYSFTNYTGFASYYYGGPVMNGTCGMRFWGSFPEFFGWAVSGAGDLNGDGFLDAAVGAENSNDGGSKSGSAYVHLWAPGAAGVNITAGQTLVWRCSDYINGTCATADFSKSLNDCLSKTLPSGKDEYGNSYVDVPLFVTGQTAGKVTLADLNITYRYTGNALEFSDDLNGLIADCRKEPSPPANLTVALKVTSSTPGTVRLRDLSIACDEAPHQTAMIPDARMDEDTSMSEPIDLQMYFDDDYDGPDQLRFGLVSATNTSIVRVELLGNRYISVDAADGPQNDNWTGEIEVVVKCSDSWGSTAPSNPFRVVVQDVPDPPVITSLPPGNATAGQECTYKVTAVDGDPGDVLTFGLASGPPNMTVDAISGLLRWTPAAGGRYGAKVSVADGTFTVYQEFSVMVPNRPPRLTATGVPESLVGVPWNFTVPAVDDDGDPLQFSLVERPEGMTVGLYTGRIDCTPAGTGTFPVRLDISDGKAAISFYFNLTVRQGNRAPRFRSGPVTSATAGLPYSYNASASDPDNDTLAYMLERAPPGMTVDRSTGRVTWTPAGAGDFNVSLKVSDGRGGEANQDFTIRVNARVRPKVELGAPAEGQKVGGRTAVSGRAVRGTLDIVKVQLRVDSGEWMDASGNTTWSFTLDTARLKDGMHSLQVRAYDGMEYSDTVNRTITVDNREAAGGKGFIPGFGTAAAMAAAAVAIVAVGWGRRKELRER